MKPKTFYVRQGNEVEVFTAAYAERLPVILKGPTGCGKTRFLEYMSETLTYEARPLTLTTVACHEDLTVGDLVGRFLLKADETVWVDGPLTAAVRNGGLCYLDEIVEARKDTTVIIHPLTDHRRMLPIDKLGQILEAHPSFLLVLSYNPGYQSALKELKPSTLQRFVTITFDYPSPEVEQEVVIHEGRVSQETAHRLVDMANAMRNLDEIAHIEGPRTRSLVHVARLTCAGLPIELACEVALSRSLTDEPGTFDALEEITSAYLGGR